MLPDTSQSMDTPANTPKTPLDTSKHPQTHQTHPPVPRNNLDYSQALIRQFERHLVCQGMSGRTLRVMRVSDAVCWMSGLFVSVKGCLWQCLGYVKGDMGVCGDIWGSLGGVGGCKGAQDGVWLSFPLQFPPNSSNFRKSHMRSLTVSSRPGGPRCLKYQNVPKLRSFWAIVKPRERFQSWDIRVYFISVLNDHTVVVIKSSS